MPTGRSLTKAHPAALLLCLPRCQPWGPDPASTYLDVLPRELRVVLHKPAGLVPASFFGRQVAVIMEASLHPVLHPLAAVVSCKTRSVAWVLEAARLLRLTCVSSVPSQRLPLTPQGNQSAPGVAKPPHMASLLGA